MKSANQYLVKPISSHQNRARTLGHDSTSSQPFSVKGAVAIALLCCVQSASYANDVFAPSGQQLTKGHTVATTDLYSSIHNPATASYLLKGKNGFKMNMFGPITGGYEFGKIDSLIDELDELVDILDQDDLTAEDALDAKNRFEPFLQNAARDGMIKFAGNANIPLLPFMYHNNQVGTFFANVSLSGSLRSTVLDDDIDIINVNDTFRINTSAALYVKSVGLTSINLGYSRPVYKTEGGLLHAGVGVNINSYKLAKNVISFAGLEDGEDVGDAIENDYENNQNTSTNVGVDLGLFYATKQYSVGLTVKDINQPEYDYGVLPTDSDSCNGMMGISVDNCFVAQEAIAAGRISASEIYVANTQTNLSASAFMGEKIKWGVHASIDLNDKNDAIGDLYQWANLSTNMQLNNWFVPEVRLGYTKNLAGTELSYYSFGLTFFKYAELDIQFSDESVEIDGTSAPRSAHLSLAVQTKF